MIIAATGNTMKNRWYIKQTISKVHRGGNKALKDVGEIIGDAGQKITPLDTGELETSESVDQDRKNLITYISFSRMKDGFDVATEQHENPNYNHLPGKRFKYLQEPLFQLGPALLPRALKDDISRELK